MNVKEAIKLLKERGYKCTEQRRAIVQSIYMKDKYVSAKEILIEVQKKHPNISFDTIYRNLTVLAKLELIEIKQQDGESKYKAPCIGTHHHHLICNKCGDMTATLMCPMEILLKDYDEDFEIHNHKLEIYGICRNCQSNIKPNN